MTFFRIPIPYHPDPTPYFAPIAGRPWAVLLDSCAYGGTRGRYSIIAAEPAATLVTRGRWTEIVGRGGRRRSDGAPLDLVRDALGAPLPTPDNVPFPGGALGYFAYDLAWRFERLPRHTAGVGMPEMAVGIYDWAVILDHHAERCWLVGREDRDASRGSRWADFFRAPPRPDGPAVFRTDGPLRSNMDREGYRRRFRRVMDYIQAGDCYQINLAQRFSVAAAGDPWPLYRHLRVTNPAPFAAFMRYPFGTVLSFSPERFLSLRHGVVETRPIKGTRPRGGDSAEDQAQARALRESAKDRAENLMIVDLLRNDLGKVCVTGSVEVPELFALERFASVHHLVSCVRGRLRPGEDGPSLLRACFPGGSVTGAPKLRAMEIVDELEPDRREVYCGAIAYMGFDGSMDSNIAIRTLLHRDGALRFWAGGGIVADSDAEAEYQETLHKAAPFLHHLGGLGSGSRTF